MTAQQNLAVLLHGSEYPLRVTREDNQQWRNQGLIVVFGASDDLIEFRGAIYDEAGAYSGGTVFITENGLPVNQCDCDDCPYFEEATRNKGVAIKAIWCAPGSPYSWEYETTIPHETFDIMEDGETFCRAMVFSIEEIAK